MNVPSDFEDFRRLSAALGRDPLRVQGPGGNTSIKEAGTMWIKASGTELAEADMRDIFVAVDHKAALAEARGERGDGSCKSTVISTVTALRPSIETTFHAALDWPVVAHTHSVATLAHVITREGREAAAKKLAHLSAVLVPYAKPGLPLTREILIRASGDVRIFLLENHGLIVCGTSATDTTALMEEVEAALALPARDPDTEVVSTPPPSGFEWSKESWIARDPVSANRAAAGSYYPDHVVFLGPALPREDHAGAPPAVLMKGTGIAIRNNATRSQRAMLTCLSDVFRRLPHGWEPVPIGKMSEEELLDWDAEKYRQSLAAKP